MTPTGWLSHLKAILCSLIIARETDVDHSLAIKLGLNPRQLEEAAQ